MREKLLGSNKKWMIFGVFLIFICLLSFSGQANASTGTINCTLARVRSGPGTTYPIIGMLAQNKVITILGQDKDWFKIEAGNMKGWISASLINQSTSSKPSASATVDPTIKVYVNQKLISFDVNPRLENGRALVPLGSIFQSLGAKVKWDKSSQKVTARKADTTVSLTIGSRTATVNGQTETLDVPAKVVSGRTLAPLSFVGQALGAQVNWDGDKHIININYSEDPEDVSTDNPGLPSTDTKSSSKTPSRSGGQIKAGRILEKAAQYLHTPYKFGGQTPAGFDCSGFVQYVFGQCGLKLPRVASAQALVGTSVAKSDLMPGDLVFFNIDGTGINHVGIYVGNGKFIAASSEKSGGVIYSKLSDKYYAARYSGARRVLI